MDRDRLEGWPQSRALPDRRSASSSTAIRPPSATGCKKHGLVAEWPVRSTRRAERSTREQLEPLVDAGADASARSRRDSSVSVSTVRHWLTRLRPRDCAGGFDAARRRARRRSRATRRYALPASRQDRVRPRRRDDALPLYAVPGRAAVDRRRREVKADARRRSAADAACSAATTGTRRAALPPPGSGGRRPSSSAGRASRSLHAAARGRGRQVRPPVRQLPRRGRGGSR